MSIIAIINQKGGSAKTTTAVNLGASPKSPEEAKVAKFKIAKS